MKKIIIPFLIFFSLFVVGSSVLAANSITSRLKGKLLLQVQDKGRIWYVDPVGLQKHEVTFANPLSLFQKLALGITNADLIKIPADLDSISSSQDSDGDGYTDRQELQSGFSPYIPGSNQGRFKIDNNLATKLKGRLLLQVQDKGRIWYIDQNGKRWEVTWGNLMSLFRKLALGITNSDLNQVGATNTADGCGSGHKFISEDLGISFCYPDKYGNNSIAVKQENNKVYVYWAGSSPESGQSVEIFEKDRVDTLKTAIEKHFQLSNYKDCSVDESTTKYNTKNGATTAELSYPFNTTSDGPWFSSGYCPDGYEMTNGIRYFYTTPDSNKFLFFSIGQYSIDLSDGRTWQDTIKLIDSTFKFTDETADWQMYTNSEYGFEFKYPKNWKTTGGGQTICEGDCFNKDNIQIVKVAYGVNADGSINDRNSYLGRLTNGEYLKISIIGGEGYYYINDVNAIKGGPSPTVYLVGAEEIFLMNFNIFDSSKTSLGEAEKLFKQILSTFKFIEKENNSGNDEGAG